MIWWSRIAFLKGSTVDRCHRLDLLTHSDCESSSVLRKRGECVHRCFRVIAIPICLVFRSCFYRHQNVILISSAWILVLNFDFKPLMKVVVCSSAWLGSKAFEALLLNSRASLRSTRCWLKGRSDLFSAKPRPSLKWASIISQLWLKLKYIGLIKYLQTCRSDEAGLGGDVSSDDHNLDLLPQDGISPLVLRL